MAEETLSPDTRDKRRVFVGGLSQKTNNDSFRTYFAQFGTVMDAAVIMDKETKNSKGFGFVEFNDPSCVDRVQAAAPHSLDAKFVETKRVIPKTERKAAEAKPNLNNMKKVFVGGYKDSVTEEDLKEYFGKFGAVDRVDFFTEKDSAKKKGFIFIVFLDTASADNCLRQCRELPEQRVLIKDARMEVKRAKSHYELRQDGSFNPAFNPGGFQQPQQPYNQGGGYGAPPSYGGGYPAPPYGGGGNQYGPPPSGNQQPYYGGNTGGYNTGGGYGDYQSGGPMGGPRPGGPPPPNGAAPPPGHPPAQQWNQQAAYPPPPQAGAPPAVPPQAPYGPPPTAPYATQAPPPAPVPYGGAPAVPPAGGPPSAAPAQPAPVQGQWGASQGYSQQGPPPQQQAQAPTPQQGQQPPPQQQYGAPPPQGGPTQQQPPPQAGAYGAPAPAQTSAAAYGNQAPAAAAPYPGGTGTDSWTPQQQHGGQAAPPAANPNFGQGYQGDQGGGPIKGGANAYQNARANAAPFSSR